MIYALLVGTVPLMFNLFVAYDTWEESGRYWFFYENQDVVSKYVVSLSRRLSYTFRITSRIIFISNFALFAVYFTVSFSKDIAVPF